MTYDLEFWCMMGVAGIVEFGLFFIGLFMVRWPLKVLKQRKAEIEAKLLELKRVSRGRITE